MIKEFWQYVTTPTALAVAKEMGFLKEAIAMQARSKRCLHSWGPHYKECQKAILTAADRAVQKRKMVIFGAGTLNDIPLDALSESFETILLVDLVFLKPARQRAASYANVTLIEHDVTESLKWIQQGQSLVQAPTHWLDDESIDLVVSLNLITQLPLIPVRWLMEQYDLPEAEGDIVGKQLIFAHLHYLQQFSGEVCLIADRVDIEFNGVGEELERFDPWWDVEQPKTNTVWEWILVPLGEVSRNKGQKNLVGVSFL